MSEKLSEELSEVEKLKLKVIDLSSYCHIMSLTFDEIGKCKIDEEILKVAIDKAHERYDKFIAENHGKVPEFGMVV